jgi:type I restriction enzyme M protein
MASSASDAGHSEKDIREKLVKTGAVDVMLAIGNNFYTRSLPCTLWFFDRAKENDENKKDKVLMLDARKIYHKVTQKINDFSPEQLQNIICIVNLYRGNNGKFASTVKMYLETSALHAKQTAQIIEQLQTLLQAFIKQLDNFFSAKSSIGDFSAGTEIRQGDFEEEPIYGLQTQLTETIKTSGDSETDLENISHQCKALRKPQDKLIKQLVDTITLATKEYQLNKNKIWQTLNVREQLVKLKTLQLQLSGNPDEEEPGLLHEVEYFYKQAHWLTSRFPDGKYTDIEGLCKIVTQQDIAAKDYSLSPGRYVGVDTMTGDDFDYEERLNEIHIELDGLNEEAIQLAQTISENFKEVMI